MERSTIKIKRPRAAARKGTARRFVPDDALCHHQASSLVPWQYRHAWAATANRELKRGVPRRIAILKANEDLNGRLDRDADYLAGASPGEWGNTFRRSLAENRTDVLLNTPNMPATAERFRRNDFATKKADFIRHPQLLREAVRQRREGGDA